MSVIDVAPPAEEQLQQSIEAQAPELMQEAVANNQLVRPEDVDLSDGVNTETEALASLSGGLAIDGATETTEAPEAVPTHQEVYHRAWEGLPVPVRGSLWGGDGSHSFERFDPIKVERIAPLIADFGLQEVEGKYTEADQDIIRGLATMTSCKEDMLPKTDEENNLESKQREAAVEFLEQTQEKGISTKGLVELLRTRENMQLVMGLYERNPDALDDPSSPLNLILRMANIPLYDLVPKAEQERYYANGQGEHADVRDSVIGIIAQTAEYIVQHPEQSEYSQEQLQSYDIYITSLESKVPALEKAGFPLEKIGKTLLTKFNPSIRMNNPDLDFEDKVMDRCLSVGDGIHDLEAIDPKIAEEVIFGRGDLTAVTELAETIQKIKAEQPEVYEVFSKFQQMLVRMESVPEISNYLEIAQKVVSTPRLYELVKDEEVEVCGNGAIMLPPNLKMLVDMNSVKPYSDNGDRFFQNCNSLNDLIADPRISTEPILHAADSLDPKQVEVLKDILQDPKMLEAYDDPDLVPYLDWAMYEIVHSLDHDQVLRSLELFRSIEKDKMPYFPLGRILRGLQPRIGSEQTPLDQELYFTMLQKAVHNYDKDGNPYDSVETVTSAASFLALKSKRFSNPEAVKKEMLEWFERSDLPFAALPGVVDIAEEAEKQGVAFEPQAVYEWMYHNPEQVKKISRHNLDRYLTQPDARRSDVRLILDETKSADEIIDEATEKVAEREDSFRIIMNIKEDAVIAVLESGGNIQSIFDRVELLDPRRQIGRAQYELMRSGVEIALGIRSLDSDEDHRVYGSGVFIDQGVPTGAVGYGDIVLVFSPDSQAIQGTTFTPEDSFHGAHRLTMEDAKILRQIKDDSGIGHGRTTSEYVEAQIPGEVALRDVEQIVVTDEKQAAALREQLPPDLRAKVVVRQPELVA